MPQVNQNVNHPGAAGIRTKLPNPTHLQGQAVDEPRTLSVRSASRLTLSRRIIMMWILGITGLLVRMCHERRTSRGGYGIRRPNGAG